MTHDEILKLRKRLAVPSSAELERAGHVPGDDAWRPSFVAEPFPRRASLPAGEMPPVRRRTGGPGSETAMHKAIRISQWLSFPTLAIAMTQALWGKMTVGI